MKQSNHFTDNRKEGNIVCNASLEISYPEMIFNVAKELYHKAKRTSEQKDTGLRLDESYSRVCISLCAFV